jgi:UDP-N-acetyl-D-glucosamine dehydrogenase|tara:strand:- start:2184 stop:3449 length:1266 start_codon:yes stop_codon:yes gene_type:complete
MTISHFREKLKNKSSRIAVIGSGYVGNELATSFVDAGFNYVSAYEKSRDRIQFLRNNSCKYYVYNDPTDLKFANIICICVPTPLSKSRLKPDMSFVDDAIDEVIKSGVEGKLIILESTVAPFTTLEYILPKLLKGSTMKVGEDFWLGFSPERIDPANADFNMSNTTKVVSGITEDCLELISALYTCVTKVCRVRNTQTAETIKLYENTFRNVNIALACELQQYSDQVGIDVWEVIRGAATKEFGFMKFFPGLIGGHCLPIDPQYLTHHARNNNFKLHLTETALAVHDSMPKHMVRLIEDAIYDTEEFKGSPEGDSVEGKKILLIGMAYKPNVSDCRESGTIDIYTLLKNRGAEVMYHDPLVPEIQINGTKLHSVSVSSVIEEVDCVVLLQNHNKFKDETLIRLEAKAFIDFSNRPDYDPDF